MQPCKERAAEIQTGVTAKSETVMTRAMDQAAASIETAAGTQTAEADVTVAAGAQAVAMALVSADVHNSALQSAAGVRRYGVSTADLQFDPQQPLQYVRCQNAVHLVRVLHWAGIHNRALQQRQVSTRRCLRQLRLTQRAATNRAATTAVSVSAVAESGAAAPAAAEGEAAPTATDEAAAALKHNRRRHKVRRRANGAPRSCVLESGRWINLPRARRAAAGTIAAVDGRKQQRKQQRRCRFHDSSASCRRSKCKYAPRGHAPAEDGPDVLDPQVEAKLEGLGHQLQIKFDRQFKELQVSTQQQQSEQQQQQ